MSNGKVFLRVLALVWLVLGMFLSESCHAQPFPIPFRGATTNRNGTAGLVPRPGIGDVNGFLRGDGTWAVPTGGAATNAITSVASNGVTMVNPATGLNFVPGTNIHLTVANSGGGVATVTVNGVEASAGGSVTNVFDASQFTVTGSGSVSNVAVKTGASVTNLAIKGNAPSLAAEFEATINDGLVMWVGSESLFGRATNLVLSQLLEFIGGQTGSQNLTNWSLLGTNQLYPLNSGIGNVNTNTVATRDWVNAQGFGGGGTAYAFNTNHFVTTGTNIHLSQNLSNVAGMLQSSLATELVLNGRLAFGEANGVFTTPYTNANVGAFDGSMWNDDLGHLWFMYNDAIKLMNWGDITGGSGITITTNSGRLLISASQNLRWMNVGLTVDGGGSAITTGNKGYIQVPYSGAIYSWTILADQSGSITFDVWKTNYAGYPPTVAGAITGGSKPAVASAIKNTGTCSGWSTNFSAGDIISFNVDSASTITRATIMLKVLRDL